MGRAGVSDEPDILMVALLEESSDRLGATRQAAQTAQEGVSTAGQTAVGQPALGGVRPRGFAMRTWYALLRRSRDRYEDCSAYGSKRRIP